MRLLLEERGRWQRLHGTPHTRLCTRLELAARVWQLAAQVGQRLHGTPHTRCRLELAARVWQRSRCMLSLPWVVWQWVVQPRLPPRRPMRLPPRRRMRRRPRRPMRRRPRRRMHRPSWAPLPQARVPPRHPRHSTSHPHERCASQNTRHTEGHPNQPVSQTNQPSITLSVTSCLLATIGA